MIVFYFVLIIAISVFEINTMLKRNLKKELGLFVSLALIALALSWIYSKNPYGISIADSVLSMLGIKH